MTILRTLEPASSQLVTMGLKIPAHLSLPKFQGKDEAKELFLEVQLFCYARQMLRLNQLCPVLLSSNTSFISVLDPNLFSFFIPIILPG